MKTKISYHNQMLDGLSNAPIEMVYHLYKEKTFLEDEIKPKENVLDVGCGDGRSSLIASVLVGSAGKVTAIDNNPLMVEIAKRKTSILNNIVVCNENAEKLSFKDNSFDKVILSMNIIGTWDTNLRLTIFRELRRVLKPNGVILGTIYSENGHIVQKKWYESVGNAKVSKIDDKFVYVNDLNYKCERFTKERLIKLFSEVSSNIKIKRICNSAYGFKAVV